MTRRPSAFRQADIKRAAAAMRKAGLDVAVVEIAPDGTIRIATRAEDAPKPPDAALDKRGRVLAL